MFELDVAASREISPNARREMQALADGEHGKRRQARQNRNGKQYECEHADWSRANIPSWIAGDRSSDKRQTNRRNRCRDPAARDAGIRATNNLYPSPSGGTRALPLIFLLHEDFARWTEARIAATPARETQFLNSSAKFLGISPAGFRALETITSQTTANLRAVSAERKPPYRPLLNPNRPSAPQRSPVTIFAHSDDPGRHRTDEGNAVGPELAGAVELYHNQHRQHVSYVATQGTAAPH